MLVLKYRTSILVFAIKFIIAHSWLHGLFIDYIITCDRLLYVLLRIIQQKTKTGMLEIISA